MIVIQEELTQFDKNQVWNLLSKPENKTIVNTKWVFRNKLDNKGNIVRNKTRLVACDFSQIKRLDFDETFALAS